MHKPKFHITHWLGQLERLNQHSSGCFLVYEIEINIVNIFERINKMFNKNAHLKSNGICLGTNQ